MSEAGSSRYSLQGRSSSPRLGFLIKVRTLIDNLISLDSHFVYLQAVVAAREDLEVLDLDNIQSNRIQ